MELVGHGTIKLTDKSSVIDRATGKPGLLWRFYIQAEDGSAFFVWSQKDWSVFIDQPAAFVFAVGNRGKGYYIRIVDVLVKETGKRKN